MVPIFWDVVGFGVVLVAASRGLALLVGVDSHIVGIMFFSSIREFVDIHPEVDGNFELFHVMSV
jgi:hypothetical protein